MTKATRCLLFALAFFVATPVFARTSGAKRHTDRKTKKKRKRYDRRKRFEKTEHKTRGGKYWRIKTDRGPMYVWIPRGYNRKTAGMVIYIHGHHNNVDEVWKYHKMAEQFRRSRQNAMFVVPEAPSNGHTPVNWPSLALLKQGVSRANIRLPYGPTVVIGHSGAFRTIAKWVDHRVLSEVILLDALYARQKQFHEFIASGKRAKNHKLIIITAGDTLKNTKAFVKKLKHAAVREKFPKSYRGFSRRERNSRVLFIRSHFSHMGLVVSGKVIPLILRVTPLRRL